MHKMHFGFLFAPRRVGNSQSLTVKPFKAAWECLALKSLPSLFSVPDPLNTCIGGRLFDLGVQLEGVGAVRPNSSLCFSQLSHTAVWSSFLSPHALDMCGIANSPHVLHRHISVLALCACLPICSWES